NLSLAQQAEFAYGVLKAMGIQRYAPKVLLVGHGSHTTNNLHAAGLECGACGGQSGEVNVRVLAQLLNDEKVREQVASKGITIPSVTEFVAALHNTTTDH
ncbi:putative inorganic carbon transporter subunit DabA, partial [Pseudoalteromonas piscicida]